MTDRIRIDRHDHIARVTLNRPEKHNAVDHEMFDAILDAGTSLARDRRLRAVVLHGEGENFCAGIDVSVFGAEAAAEGFAERMRPREGSIANYYQGAALVWREMPVPVIAALHGVVFGAGLQIALGADLRLAEPSARLSVMEIKWGIIPDMGLTATLPGLTPIDRAAELAWTGRIVEAPEAADLGLVTRVEENALGAAMLLAEAIAARSPDAVRAIKTLLYDSWREPAASGLRREAELQMRVMSLPNQREAVAANLERRAPDFGDAKI